MHLLKNHRQLNPLQLRLQQQQQQARVPTVSEEYGGKWIAWNADGTRIVSAGDEATKVRADALAAGETDPILENVPPSDAFFIGGL